MATISKAESTMLRALIEEDGWDVLTRMLDLRIQEISARAAETLGKDAFEELRVLHKCQGAVEELRKFFDDAERGAFE